MSNPEQVLVSRPDAAWLPDGGRADVVLAGGYAAVPSPTCLVRLLATREGMVFVVARADGGGLDIPTLEVGDGVVEDCMHALQFRALGSVHPTTLLGWVRNVVQEAPADYLWPSPDAYFVVWHCQLPAAWVGPSVARSSPAARRSSARYRVAAPIEATGCRPREGPARSAT